MSSDDRIRFDAFAEELFLSYLTTHAIWGGPAPIPSQERCWSPKPTTILITKAACQRFRETAERLAYAVPLEQKLGGVTFARKVMELYEATLNQAEILDGSKSTNSVERSWNFTVERSKKGVVLNFADQAEKSGVAVEKSFAGQLDLDERLAPDRRRFFGLAVTFPAALMPKTATAKSFEQKSTRFNGDSPLEGQRVFTDCLVEDATKAANSLSRLFADPNNGLRFTGRTTLRGNRIFEIDKDTFLSPVELASVLIETIDPAKSRSNDLTDCRRYMLRAQRDQHVRYHYSLANLLLQSISDHHAKGTNWYGPFAPAPSPHSDLVASAVFELQNHREGLRAKEIVISESREQFTIENEAHLVLGAYVFSLDKSRPALGPLINCRSFRTLSNIRSLIRKIPQVYVWPCTTDQRILPRRTLQKTIDTTEHLDIGTAL